MINGVQNDRMFGGDRTQPHGRATAIRTDLGERQTWQRVTSRVGCVEERITFVFGHEALGSECNRAQAVVEPTHRCEC